jgi:hypothetical protein
MDRYFDTLPSFEHTSKRRKGFLSRGSVNEANASSAWTKS